MQDYAKIFKALSDENRIKILERIQASAQTCEGSCDTESTCVSSLAESLGITAATASHHIKELVNAGLITTRKKGRWVYCEINREAVMRARDFLSQLRKEGL